MKYFCYITKICTDDYKTVKVTVLTLHTGKGNLDTVDSTDQLVIS